MVDEAMEKAWDEQDKRIRKSIDKLNQEAKLSKHSEKRLKQRAGLSRSSAKRNIEKVLEEGFHATQFTGSMRRYLDKHLHHENHSKGVKLFVHNYFVYVVDTKTNTLITTWHLPPKFRRVYDAEKKKARNHAE